MDIDHYATIQEIEWRRLPDERRAEDASNLENFAAVADKLSNELLAAGNRARTHKGSQALWSAGQLIDEARAILNAASGTLEED